MLAATGMDVDKLILLLLSVRYSAQQDCPLPMKNLARQEVGAELELEGWEWMGLHSNSDSLTALKLPYMPSLTLSLLFCKVGVHTPPLQGGSKDRR